MGHAILTYGAFVCPALADPLKFDFWIQTIVSFGRIQSVL